VKRGRFVQPTSAADAIQEIEDLASPVSAFVRERCDIGAGYRVDVEYLYKAWRNWCEQGGRNRPGTVQSFGRDLAAAAPGVKRKRGTDDQPFYAGIALRGIL
jgi:putative DNA primase/helicase